MNQARHIGVAKLALTHLKAFGSSSGNLVALEGSREIPFPIARAFYIWGVEPGGVRGRHAHHRGHQFFVCLYGSYRLLCDDGEDRREFTLDDRELGLHVPPMIWAEQTYSTADTVALVFADQAYDRSDYIEDYAEFVSTAAAKRALLV